MKVLKNLFKKSSNLTLTDIPISKDMHSHLLPGLDDGAETLEDSIELIKNLQNLGYKKLITTPHVMGDFYKNTPEDIQNALTQLREAVNQEGLEVEIEAGAEYYMDEWFLEKLEDKRLMSFGDNYVLVETSFMNRPNQLLDTFFRIKLNGYKPIFAHPERYLYLYEDFEKYKKIYNTGVYFQINLNSLTGYYSPDAKLFAEKLIKNNMVDFVGSDTHRLKHIDLLKEAMKSRWFPKLKELNLLNETL